MSDRHDKKRSSMAANLEEQTGQSINDWIDVVAESNLAGFSVIVDWLKREHGLGHFQARLVAEAFRDR